jgi:hypothetical protein
MIRDWIDSCKVIRNRDLYLNASVLVLVAFIVGLLIGSEGR